MTKSPRLYKKLQPSHYDLELSIDRDKMAFSGKVSIKAEAIDTKIIKLHSKNLEIATAEVDGKAVEINHDDENDVLELQTAVETGEHQIELTYSGEITDPMTGIYPCYFTHEGEDKKLIATQFESHHAREVFPCVDEPEAKATFRLTLKTAENKQDQFVSNTLPEKQTTKAGMTTTTFKTTPIMSTYLLAFVYGEMKCLEAKTQNGTLVRTWATPDNYQKTEFALDVAVQALDFYNDYFDIPYPLEKCDHLALPDFAAGAMENWGCITYRESALLVDEHTSTSSKQWVAIVVAHELTHQWFGNLVTMQWWNDLWLNEGFASWMEYLAIDELFPDWQMWTQFVTDDYMHGQVLDSLANTHPIEVPIDNPEDIRSIFDAISYSKGASVIRMLHAYLGPEDFRNGIRHYLQTHSYANTTTSDLWKALETVSGKKVRKFMGAWTEQAGFPELNVTTDKTGKKLKLQQSRFYSSKLEKAKSKDQSIWPIPLDMARSDEVIMVDKKSQSIELSKVNKFPKLNSDQTGFYVVNYDDHHLHELMESVSSQQLNPIDRLGVLSDTFQMAKAGERPTISALELIEHYADEHDAAVWDEIAADLGSLRKVMGSDELKEAIKPYLRKLTQKQVDRLGWKPKAKEPHFDTLLRPTVLGLASSGENQAVVEEALKRFNETANLAEIEADLRGVVYGTAVRQGGKAEFDKLLECYRQSQSAQEKQSLSAALCSFEDTKLTKKARDMIMTDEVKLQDVVSWFAYLMGNRYSRMDTWQWLQDNWDWILKNFGTDIMTFSYFPLIVGRSISDAKLHAEFLKFFDSVETTGIEAKVAQGAEAIEWQSDWRERDYQEVLAYFNNYK